MIRTKGEAGTGNVIQAVQHQRTVQEQIGQLQAALLVPHKDKPGHGPIPPPIYSMAKEWGSPVDILYSVAQQGRLPVVNFAAGGVATPADAALMMALGSDGVFVGSGIFKSGDPMKRAKAIVQAVTHWQNPATLAKVSENIGAPMTGIGMDGIHKNGTVVEFAKRGV